MNSSSATNPAEFSVLELMSSGRYTVPLYQRNYAWGEMEIVQLLQDLRDASSHQKPNYYLGSLVVHAHTDGHFEIIDGQQRHTTLCILLAVLKNQFKQALGSSSFPDPIAKLNLGFDCRDVSENTLELLFKGQVPHDQAQALEPSMINASKLIHKNLKNMFGEEQSTPVKMVAFTAYVLQHVKLLRVIVPVNTDLNHYFEIMNSRGEQLEMHEILKARLMEVLDRDAQKGFATLWDACADMQRFSLMGFSAAERTAIFGADWNEFPLGFDDYLQKLTPQGSTTNNSSGNAELSNSSPCSLAEIAANPMFYPKDAKHSSDSDAEGRFGAVVNFPNFLLHVLLVKKQDKNVPLDDKRLLMAFDDQKVDNRFTAEFVKSYAITLLRLRLLWDRFIIKSSDDKWSIKRIQRDGSKDSPKTSLINTFASPSPQSELEMQLSMFHVSFPAQSDKYWLAAALNYLHTENLTTTKLSVDGTKFLNFLECVCDRFFFGRHGADAISGAAMPVISYPKLIFDAPAELSTRVLDPSALHKGTGVANFIFNRLDYLLWKRCHAKNPPLHGNDIDIAKLAGEFRFTFRSSVEHYYPQHPRDNNDTQLPTLKECDNFGNLCLISHSNNSRYSDFLPAAKKQLRAASKSNESLKQLFMMSYPDWGPGHEPTMYAHESAMIDTLKQRSTCPPV